MFKHVLYLVRFEYSISDLFTELKIWSKDDAKDLFFSGSCEYDCSSVFALKRLALTLLMSLVLSIFIILHLSVLCSIYQVLHHITSCVMQEIFKCDVRKSTVSSRFILQAFLATKPCFCCASKLFTHR